VTTPGYSGRPQAAKLGLKPEQRVYVHHAPDGWALTDPPAGLAGPGPDGRADVVLAFFTRAEEIGDEIGELARRIYPAGALWVAWRSGWSTSRWPPSTTTGPACAWSGVGKTASPDRCAGRTMDPWVSLDAEGLRFPFSPSR
jgi:hypothetical protein